MTDTVSEQYKEALRRGHLAVVKGRPLEAVQHYEEAGRLAADRPVPFVSIGSVFLQMRRPRESVRAYDEALRRAPNDLEALRGKARALEAEGETREAGTLEQRAAELEATDQAAMQAQRVRSAQASGMEQRFGAAVAASRASDGAMAVQEFMATAHGYLVEGAHGAAFDALMRALAVRPGALDVHLVMADIYLRRGWKGLGVERLLLIERRLGVDADPGAQHALADVARRHRELDPQIERLAATNV